MRYMRLRDSSNAVGRKRASLVAIGVISTLCLISFLYSQKIVTALPSSPAFLSIGRSIQSLSSNEVSEPLNLTQDIDFVLLQQQRNISIELSNYDFSPEKTGVPSAKSIKDFILRDGGQPIRSIVITTWRSGSTFLGEILDSVPGNYYHYEPFLDQGIIQIRGPPKSESALQRIRQLLNCNYSNLDNYLAYGMGHKELFAHNRRLWEKCVAYPHLCYYPPFLNKFCSLFPFHSMKVVRLRLSLIEDLLEDPKLRVRVLYVVRDPRGTMQSRKHRKWCPTSVDCSNASTLCADLTADFSAAVRLSKKFPKTFKAVRYEDLSVDPYKGAINMLQFFGREYSGPVKRFLDSHTVHDIGGVSSTYRNSKSAPFHWRTDLSHPEVQQLQKHCKTAMAAWGYVRAMNASHQKVFDPIKGHFAME